MVNKNTPANQCQKPSGWLGRLIVWNMNSRHSKVTDWGLSQVSIKQDDTILDVGCGGGRTISKLADMAGRGKVYGLDHSGVCVAMAGKLNQGSIDMGRVAICEGSVSALPFNADTFELVTAVDTHFWWPDLAAGVTEIRRVLKPGGSLVIVAEIYKGAASPIARLVEKRAPRTGIKVLSPDEHRNLLTGAGYLDVNSAEEARKGWICATGKKAIA